MINSNASNRCKMIGFRNETLPGVLRDIADWIEQNSPRLACVDVQWRCSGDEYYVNIFYDYKFSEGFAEKG